MTALLTDHPIDLSALMEAVAAPDRGGVATFLGLVRNHHDGHEVLRLEYSAYVPMAAAELGRIVAEAEARWPARLAVQHRLGALRIGDVAVAVVAASAHRAPAFEACRHVIEEIKHRVPIWKREFHPDGSVTWVDPTARPSQLPEVVSP